MECSSDGSEPPFPKFMLDSLDEFNSVRFVVNNMGEKKRPKPKVVDLNCPSLPSISSDESDEESDSSEEEFSVHLSGGLRSNSDTSSSNMSDPLSASSSQDSDSDKDGGSHDQEASENGVGMP